ncbi:MAG: hypothetical protein M0Q95_17145 [Porticoccaceae bacterium]|nr:hypothetical protein [Porticoccaceae bacterium]
MAIHETIKSGTDRLMEIQPSLVRARGGKPRPRPLTTNELFGGPPFFVLNVIEPIGNRFTEGDVLVCVKSAFPRPRQWMVTRQRGQDRVVQFHGRIPTTCKIVGIVVKSIRWKDRYFYPPVRTLAYYAENNLIS